MGGLGELVHHVAGALALGVAEVERLAVEVGLVRDVVHGRGDVVDGHDVRVAELWADEREPAGQVVPGELDRGEEVVRTVDLVHFAGPRVADDDRGTVDPPRHLRLGAGDLLGLELRPVVRVIELLALVEHVLTEQALVLAGGGDGGGVVKAAGVDRVGELDGVARALDVGDPVALLVGGHVVDRREVEEVVDRAVQLIDGGVVEAEARLGQVAGDRLDPCPTARAGGGDPLLRDQRLKLVARSLTYEHVDVSVALQQARDKVSPDEPGRARDEIGHVASLLRVVGAESLSRGGRWSAGRPGGYQPPRQSTFASRRLAASILACLRLSSRHWMIEKTVMTTGKKAITMNIAFVISLSFVSPYQP